MKVIFSIIFIMSGLAFLARYLYLIKKCSIRVSAVIIDIEIHNDSRNKHIYPTYRYKIEHWWYTAKSQVDIPYYTKKPKYKIGDEMDILVCSSDHKFCIPAEYADLKKLAYDPGYGIMGIVAGILILIFF
ncbi:MAG: hypothetical protein VZR06_19395 [Butyrivibrio sp.]|nr:hypothetical protein [Butyrivibrio sp.]